MLKHATTTIEWTYDDQATGVAQVEQQIRELFEEGEPAVELVTITTEVREGE